MNDNDVALQEMEKEINDLDKVVDTLKTLERLEKNRDFQELFLDQYADKHLISLVRRKASPELQGDEDQKDIDNQLMAISFFLRFIEYIREMGELAKTRVQNTEYERDILLKGENF